MARIRKLGELDYPDPEIWGDIGKLPFRTDKEWDSYTVSMVLRLDQPIIVPKQVIDLKRADMRIVHREVMGDTTSISTSEVINHLGGVVTADGYDILDCPDHWPAVISLMPQELLLAISSQQRLRASISLRAMPSDNTGTTHLMICLHQLDRIGFPDRFLQAFARKLNKWLGIARMELEGAS